MGDLTVVVPTRNRPEAAARLAARFADTCTADTELLFAVDASDPARSEYIDLVAAKPGTDVVVCPSTTMVEALNFATQATPTFAVGFMGDDHRPVTRGWDSAYLDALRELGTGMVYGDDLFQHERIPTQIAMTTDIVRACGWMVPPALVHLFVDDWWLSLGRAAGCISYLPEVVVEHVHPAANKAVWDEGHLRVNQPRMYEQDGATMSRLRVLELPRAAAAVRALRGDR